MKRSLTVLPLALIVSLQTWAASEARAQPPTSVMEMVPNCGDVCKFAVFMAKQWGTMPFGREYFVGAIELPLLKSKDMYEGLGNGFFVPSQYAADCNTPLYIENKPASPSYIDWRGDLVPAKPAKVVHICKATSVPVVNASFIGKLQAAGLQYHLVYPIKDNGNGRGYVVWNSFPSTELDSARSKTFGYARIEGVSWENQFQTYGDDYARGYPHGYAHGDIAGDFIAAQDSPVRETTLRLAIPGVAPNLAAFVAGFVATMVTDDWLAGAPTPTVQLPPIPPYVAAGDPTAINVGGVSSGGGAGSEGIDPLDGRNSIKFDYAAFCSSPGKDGQPRSPAWVANCMSGH